MSPRRLATLAALTAWLAATLVEAGAPDAGVRMSTKRSRVDAGEAIPVQPAGPLQGGPTPGCPPDCYSSCGGGAMREPGPPTDRERRCAGCRNICMDTGKWPPSIRR